ncbi:MAG TPA: hypothetical protein VFF69_15780 [Phycisphaerales bacterium]|nr:hypothetical protein [Phycisphaerales bacterium]
MSEAGRPPARARWSLAGALERAGHLALWPGLYFAGVYAGAALMLGTRPSAPALGASFCAGVGLYLLDRVKARDQWLDRADADAQPVRHGFLMARRRRIRALAWGMLALGAAAAASITPLNLLLPPVGIGGVIVYGSVRGRRARPKDVLLVKNLLPGGAIAGLGVTLALESPVRGSPPTLAYAAAVGAGLVLVVTADAMLCDLDDASVDRAFGTQTVPARYGRKATWLVAMAMHLGAAAVLLGIGGFAGTLGASAIWAATDLAVTAGLWIWDPPALRDLIDGRLALVGAIAWGLAP